MDALQAIRERRSVKHYDPAHRMTEDEIRTLLGHAMLAPTSFNIQHWRFVVVTDPALRRQLRAAAWDQAQVTEASILVAVCADTRAHAKDPGRYWRDAPAAARDVLVPLIGPFYDGNERLQRDEALRSAGLAGATLMIAAKAMGYDSSPMIGFDPQKVGELLRLPQDHLVAFLVAVGKGTQPAWPRPGQLAFDEVVLRDRFPAPAGGRGGAP